MVLVGLNVCSNKRCRNIARSPAPFHFNILTENNPLPDSDPEILTKAKRGADLHILIADVDDWLYSTGTGKDTQGGYTLACLTNWLKPGKRTDATCAGRGLRHGSP